MSVLLSLLPVIGRSLLQVILSPLFVILILIVGWQYKRMQRLSEQLFYIEKRIYLRSTVTSTLAGVAGGVLGSFFLILLGVDLSQIGIAYLFLVAILLMLIHPRFLCFAYAGGLLSLSSLLFGVPQIDVPQLMGLVAVLHSVESILILVSGYVDPIPVYIKRDDQRVVGGFNLQKFWPIPLVAVMNIGGIDFTTAGFPIPDWWRPEWWPLIKSYTDGSLPSTYGLLPVLAILGYGEITTTAPPRIKTRYSAANLLAFSLVLLFFAVVASHYPGLSLLPALFGPLGHELVIMIGLRAEAEGQPVFIMPERGVMILDVLPGSVASAAGLRSQDVVISVNGVVIRCRRELQHILQFTWGWLDLEVLRGNTTLRFRINKSPREALGIILVPESQTERHLSFSADTILSRLLILLKRSRD